jgi:hypothetical protein
LRQLFREAKAGVSDSGETSLNFSEFLELFGRTAFLAFAHTIPHAASNVTRARVRPETDTRLLLLFLFVRPVCRSKRWWMCCRFPSARGSTTA